MKKGYVGWKKSFYQTSFWSPIGSRWELRTKFDHFSKWFHVPRLFGVFENMYTHKTTIETQYYWVKTHKLQWPRVKQIQNSPTIFPNNALWSKIAMRIQIRNHICTQVSPLARLRVVVPPPLLRPLCWLWGTKQLFHPRRDNSQANIIDL